MVVADGKAVIGFIGVGVMGKSMVSHLLKSGYAVNVYTRTKGKADDILEAGAIWKASPAEIAKSSDIIITIVGTPRDVEDIYLGENGLLSNCKNGSMVIDMTTSSPQLAQKIYTVAKEFNVQALDAPVSGGDIGAREARLAIMVGGDREALDRARPILEVMGQNIVYQGPAGNGQHCKMANQIVVASAMMGVSEAICYSEKAGLDPETVLATIETGAAASWLLSNLGPKMIQGDCRPGFSVNHFIKDMGIALESCEAVGLDASGLAQAKALYDKLEEKGLGDLGTQALYKYYQ